MAKKKTLVCRTCGKPLKKGFKLCPYCGTQVDMVCLNCGKGIEEDFRICPYCGEVVMTPLAGPLLRAKAAGFLTGAGTFLTKIWEVARKGAVAAFNWLKLLPGKLRDWIRSLDWAGFKAAAAGTLTAIGDFFVRIREGIQAKDWPVAREKLAGWGASAGDFFKPIFAWLKKATAPARTFLKKTFDNRRGSPAAGGGDEKAGEEE